VAGQRDLIVSVKRPACFEPRQSQLFVTSIAQIARVRSTAVRWSSGVTDFFIRDAEF
jgi:hypothetical protein